MTEQQPEAPDEIRRLEISVTAGDALIREILEALCHRDGLPLESSVVPGEPARNYDLAIRLGIGRVFGIREPEVPVVPGVTRWHPKPAAAEAHRWRKNGDHPADNCRMITPNPASTTQFAPFMSEGEIVRYYRHPCDDGKRECGDCGARMHDHGWIDQGMMGRVVCPGDWVVSLPLSTPGLVAYIPVKPDVFTATYEPAPEPLTASQLDRLRRMAGEDAITTAGRAAAIVEALEAPPAVAEDIRIQLDVMGALLAALCDPGRFTDRAPHEPMSWWQRRAVIEHAAPYIAAAERERIRQMAIRTRAACYGDGGHSFADLLGPDAAGTGPQS